MPGTPFKPGQSGNPAGRPKKERALSHLLQQAGNVTELDDEGKRISRARRLAAELWAMALDRALRPDDRIAAAKLIYSQVDGPPKSEHDVNVITGPQIFIPEERDE